MAYYKLVLRNVKLIINSIKETNIQMYYERYLNYIRIKFQPKTSCVEYLIKTYSLLLILTVLFKISLILLN